MIQSDGEAGYGLGTMDRGPFPAGRAGVCTVARGVAETGFRGFAGQGCGVVSGIGWF